MRCESISMGRVRDGGKKFQAGKGRDSRRKEQLGQSFNQSGRHLVGTGDSGRGHFQPWAPTAYSVCTVYCDSEYCYVGRFL